MLSHISDGRWRRQSSRAGASNTAAIGSQLQATALETFACDGFVESSKAVDRKPEGALSLAGMTAIYGGSFNPPHVGHRRACEYLLSRGAEEVWVVPAYVHTDKKDLVNFDHRVAMCELMTAGLGDRVQVHSVEARVLGSGESWQLMRQLRAEAPCRPFVLALGTDLKLSAPSWGRWDSMVREHQVEWIPRAGLTLHEQSAAEPEASSSEVRRRLASGQPVTGLLSETVETYLRRHHLYTTPQSVR